MCRHESTRQPFGCRALVSRHEQMRLQASPRFGIRRAQQPSRHARNADTASRFIANLSAERMQKLKGRSRVSMVAVRSASRGSTTITLIRIPKRDGISDRGPNICLNPAHHRYRDRCRHLKMRQSRQTIHRRDHLASVENGTWEGRSYWHERMIEAFTAVAIVPIRRVD